MLEELVTAEGFGIALIFVRVGSALMLLPGIGEPYIYARLRLMVALALSLALAGPLEPALPAPPAEIAEGALLVVGEAAIGLFIGAATRVVFAALHIAGSVMAFQSGLAAAAIFDPNEATQGTLPGNLLAMTGLVLLFATDAHHTLLQALAASYAGLPPGGGLPLDDATELMIRMVDETFAVALKIAAPLILISLLAYLVMGVLNRLMPAFQVLFVAMPLQLLLTLATMMLTLAGGLLAFFDLFERSLAALPMGG